MGLFDYVSPEWMGRAACPDTEDFDIFFSYESADCAKAQAECAACPVLYECGTYAIENKVRYGIWGGLTPDQRSAVRRHPARRAYFMARLDNPPPVTDRVVLPRRVTTPRPKPGPRIAYRERLEAFGVQPSTVRTWALDQGLDVPERGTIAHAVLDAYEHAHRPAAA